MLAEDQPQVGLACLPNPGAVGVDHHAFQHLVVAGGHQALMALHLHHADAAGGDFVEPFQKAQMRDLDTRLCSGLQNGGAGGHLDVLSIDCRSYHCSTRPPLNTP